MILVDTSVWIDYFNGHSVQEVEFLIEAIASNQDITIPGLVLTEILLGLKTDKEAAQISGLLDAFASTPECDYHDYQEAAGIYRFCRAQGITIRSTIDCLLAQLCLRHEYDLLTKDRNFYAIAKCVPLQFWDPA